MAAPPREPPDWQSLYEQAQTRAEQERARADAAEGRCEQLRRAERAARSRAGSLKWQLDKSRDKLETAVEEVTEVRRAAEDALFYQAEMTRLEKLLSQAGVDSRKRSTITSLRMEVFQLREALQASEAGKRYGRTSAWRHPPVSQRRAGAGNQEGDDQSTAPGGRFPEPGERPAAQGAGAVAGAEGRAGGVAQEGRGASQGRNGRHRRRGPGRAPSCARRWNARASRRSRSRRCAGKSGP